MLSPFVIILSPSHLSLIFAFVHCFALLSPLPRNRDLRTIQINMTTPNIDTNHWYQLYVNEDKSQSLLGTSFFTKGGTKGAVFFNTTNTTLPSQRWQIFPVTINSTTTYTIRSKDSGPNGFMGTAYSEDEDAEGKTRPSIFRGDVAGNNVYWSFDSWGDGTSFLINTANGTAYHLNKKGNGIMNMSPNISAPQNGQRWGFATIDKIDDEKYSSVNLVGLMSSTSVSSTFSATSSTLSSASPTTTVGPNSDRPLSPGLSTGIKAAIGVVVGVILLLALILFGLHLWKKRKQRSQYAQPQEMPYDEPYPKYELHQDTSMKYELPSAMLVEVPNHERPAELPGHLPDTQGRYP